MSARKSSRGASLAALLSLLLVAAALAVALAGPAAAERAQRHGGNGTLLYRLAGKDTQAFPEGIAVDRRTGSFFVSSVARGTIYRGRLSKHKARVFLPGGVHGRSSSAGLKVDRRGRLYVAGAATGYVWVYDIRSGRLIRRFSTGSGGFINDLVVTPSGDVWVTDSFRPVLWRIRAAAIRPGRQLELDPQRDALDVTATGYQPGAFNLNGIVAGPRGRYLIAVHSNRGELWRIELPSGRVSRVDAASVPSGDGLVRRGSVLYVVRNANAVDKLRLSDGGGRARLLSTTTDPSFDFTTTAALADRRLLVVNSQFDDMLATPPRPGNLPFTVSSIRRP